MAGENVCVVYNKANLQSDTVLLNTIDQSQSSLVSGDRVV